MENSKVQYLITRVPLLETLINIYGEVNRILYLTGFLVTITFANVAQMWLCALMKFSDHFSLGYLDQKKDYQIHFLMRQRRYHFKSKLCQQTVLANTSSQNGDDFTTFIGT